MSITPETRERRSTHHHMHTVRHEQRLRTPAAHREHMHLLALKLVRVFSVCVILILCGGLLWSHYGHVPSRHSLINGSTFLITAPQGGLLQLKDMEPGEVVRNEMSFGKIANPKTADMEAEFQKTEARLTEEVGKLQSLRDKIAARQHLLGKFSNLVGHQKTFDVQYAETAVERATHEREEKAKIAEYANNEANRYQILAKEGAISMAEADEARTASRRYSAILNQKSAELDLAKEKLNAIKFGLQLDSNRAFSTPAIEMQNLQKEITDLRLEAADMETQIRADRSLLTFSKNRLVKHSNALVRTPRGGVVWSVEAKSGELVKEGDPLIRLLSPYDRWVETYISEQDASRIKIGDKVKIKLLGDTTAPFSGTVRSLRAGIDRSAATHNASFGRVAVPPPEELHHEIAVRISVDWNSFDNVAKLLGPTEFFGVGRSVEVTF